MEIIRLNPSDVNELLILSRKTFDESFGHLNKPENMDFYMDRAFTIEKLFSELLNPFTEFYFLKINIDIVGYLKVNTHQAQSDLNDELSLEIERIYIDSRFQGSGYGAVLIEQAKQRCRALKLSYIWLGVWEKNTDGIRFYQRHGFEIFSSHPFVFGDEVQTDLLMKYYLEKDT
ncbi:MAG: GNAT family N-acetyltransferase [Saprospiraceae bacterium]